MNPIFAAALELQRFCEQRLWKYCFIGGIAVQRWGEPRLTKDADLTLLAGFGKEEIFVDALLSRFGSRRDDARDFALKHRVVLAQTQSGVPLDIALGALPFEENSVGRATPFRLDDTEHLLTCSAEDLIVYKAFASRELDWLDIDRILKRQGGALDFGLIWRELRPLVEAKEAPDILPRLETAIRACR